LQDVRISLIFSFSVAVAVAVAVAAAAAVALVAVLAILLITVLLIVLYYDFFSFIIRVVNSWLRQLMDRLKARPAAQVKIKIKKEKMRLLYLLN
jgi:hypothetical protein